MADASHQDFYEEATKHLPSPELIFLNYGFDTQACRESSSWISPKDRRYRCHLNLVHHVMSGVELAGATILEVGSGRGGNCRYLSQYTAAKAIYGLDLCDANVRFCHAEHRLPNVTFLRGDAQRLPFRSQAFDVVLNLESSHCYPNLEQFLTEVHRVLKPQGIFCYADLWFLKYMDLDWKARKQALDTAPFLVISEEDISGPVCEALTSSESLSETVRAMANETNGEFVEKIVQKLNVVWITIAAHRLSYLAWKFRKS